MREVLLLLGVVPMLLGIGTPAPRGMPPRPVPTPRFIPKTASPRFFIAGDVLSDAIWAFRTPPGKNTFTYYFVDSAGTINELRYDVTVKRSVYGLELSLSRNGWHCRTYRAHFDDNEQRLWVAGGYATTDPEQAFDVVDDNGLSQSSSN